MKYLGIDYGKKNVGLSISDSSGLVAMPLKILENDKFFLEKILEIIEENNIEEIVLGESLNYKGEKNKIQKEIDALANFLEENKIKVNFVNEIFTSMESKWGIEKKIRREEKGSKKQKKNGRIDDKAATMILKTFLESKK